MREKLKLCCKGARECHKSRRETREVAMMVLQTPEGWGTIIYEIRDFNISREKKAGYLFLRLFSFLNLFKAGGFLPFDVECSLHFQH